MRLISLKDEKEKEKQQSCCEKDEKRKCIHVFFQNMPSYFRSERFPTRSDLATFSVRCENTAVSAEEQCNNFCNADKIKSFNDLTTKVSEDLHRHGYVLHRTKEGRPLVHFSS